MPDEARPDWRLLFETTLAADMPAAYSGGPEHKAGARIVMSTLGARRGAVPLGFATPSTSALALSAAIRAAADAAALRSSLRYTPNISPWGPAEAVTDETMGKLYDFFEQAYIAIVFSYQAVEAFANEEIQRLVTAPQHLSLRGRWEDLDADACERWLSTGQKIADLLPGLLGITAPKKEKWWPAFKELGRLRDATIHLKARHAYPRTGEPTASFFHELLAVRSLAMYPQAGVGAIEHLHQGRERPTWLQDARRLAEGMELI
jgi:hypothetical protein